MKPTNKKCLRITELDFLLANRKAAREEEILAHGKPIIFRIHLQNSKNRYNRMQMKKAIIRLGDGFRYQHNVSHSLALRFRFFSNPNDALLIIL